MRCCASCSRTWNSGPAGEAGHLASVRRSPNVTTFYRYGWCYADPYGCRHISMRPQLIKRRWVRLTGASATAGLLVAGGLAATPSEGLAKPVQTSTTITTTGLKAGQIKHVWLIILENKSYDATFTGLNQNSYLWKTLPAQGVLLKNYYGTGHFSQDNYESLVSGQATQQDTQFDC